MSAKHWPTLSYRLPKICSAFYVQLEIDKSLTLLFLFHLIESN